jgi:hypothetical protein
MASVPVRILLIQSWVVRSDHMRVRLCDAGYLPRLYRVDFEAALVAALSRGNFDIVLHDPTTPKLPRTVVEACMKEHGIRVPLVDLGDLNTIGDRVRASLGALKN